MATTVVSTGFTAQQLGESTAKWVQRITLETAMSVLREEVGHGFDNEPVVITDGVTRRDPAQVKPFGKIEFVARQNYADVVLWALDQLRRRSPVLTGRYVELAHGSAQRPGDHRQQPRARAAQHEAR